MLGLENFINDFKTMEKYSKLWFIFATLSTFLITFYVEYTNVGTLTTHSIIGLISALANIMCVILVAQGKISNYFFGLIGVVLYAYVSYTNRYYGDFMLNAFYYFPMQFIGYYIWKKSEVTYNDSTVESKYLTTVQRIKGSILCCFAIFCYGMFLTYKNGNLPFLDSTSTVLSVVAMYLMAKRYAEQWILWIIVNIVTIYMWATVFVSSGTEIATFIQWLIFLVNSIIGLVSWIKRHNNVTTVKRV